MTTAAVTVGAQHLIVVIQNHTLVNGRMGSGCHFYRRLRGTVVATTTTNIRRNFSSSSSSTQPTSNAPRLASIFHNTTVPNEGSIARDILAAERTFLAWGRTGLGFVGAGSALFAAYHNREADDYDDGNNDEDVDNNGRHKQRTNDQTNNKIHNASAAGDVATTTTTTTTMLDEVLPACAILIANGIFLLGFATRRYVAVVNALQYHNSFPIHVGGTLLAVMTTAAGTLSSLAIVARARFYCTVHARPLNPKRK
jgi:uncharacterized membrane protein YidH (DUF202 family)